MFTSSAACGWVDEVQLAWVSTLVSLAFGPLKFVIMRFPGHIMSVCRGGEMNCRTFHSVGIALEVSDWLARGWSWAGAGPF